MVENKLIEDVEFTSPSAAAAFLFGGSVNGRTSWNLLSNPSITLAEWERQQELAGLQLRRPLSHPIIPDLLN
ncbi:DUF4357 domain-containing protein [Corynebacterium sp. CCUG 70398]|nr:DUF4357 domain-containing protein [Corynebacterium sp. CCUG 70398]